MIKLHLINEKIDKNGRIDEKILMHDCLNEFVQV